MKYKTLLSCHAAKIGAFSSNKRKKPPKCLDSKLFFMHMENLCICVAGWFFLSKAAATIMFFLLGLFCFQLVFCFVLFFTE